MMKDTYKNILIGYYERDPSTFTVYCSFNYECKHEIINALEAFIENYPENPEFHDIPLQSYRIVDVDDTTTRHAPLFINSYLNKIKHESKNEEASSHCPDIKVHEDKIVVGIHPMGVYHAEF